MLLQQSPEGAPPNHLHSPSSSSHAESSSPLRDSTQRVPGTFSEEPHSRGQFTASLAASGRRKAAPSPLEHSRNAPYSPYHDTPRSPREKLDLLLAEEDLHAAPSPSSSTVASPPTSPAAMPPPSRPNGAVRTPSIDSSASSTATHAYRPSQDTTLANPPNMAGLIAAAGSPEAALMAMWREKQSTASHNAQLWRLVEKQRSMVIGLQKDLERALKDKDRYRRKLKEVNEQQPPVPGALQRADTFGERDASQSPKAEQKSSPLTQQHAASQLVPDSHLAHSPSHSEPQTASSNPGSSVNSPTDYSVQPLSIGARGLGLDAATAPQQPATPPPTTQSRSQLEPPALSVTQATPVIGGNGFESPRKQAQPQRKAPPAPLNLSKPVTTSAHLHQATRDDAESDYDDTLEISEIPIVEQRGRRKTREADDRVREAMAVKEEQARSKSKKKSESKGKPTPIAAEATESSQQPIDAAPLSPRQFNPLTAGLPLSPRHPPASSLNAMLSPTNSDSSMMANRSVASISSPLMSPGLPSSPRPTDRPLGSPLPRHPKQTIASPPMSPSAMIHPTTRSLQQPGPLPPNTPQSYQSPSAAQNERHAPQTSTASSSLLAVPNAQPSPDSNSSSPTLNDTPDVYRGLVSDQYPDLLLPPNALPSIEVKVFSSRLRPSRLSFLAPRPQEEDPVFILAIYARSDNKQLWRVEKTIATLPALDAQLRASCDLHAKLPDRALFSGHAPAKIDARRSALNQYFDTVLETPMNEKAAQIVCGYISADVMGAQAGNRLNPEPTTLAPVEVAPKTRQRKEGYLTKRGKNFGGWKARFFVLDGPEFRYYEIEGGAHLGTIKLQSAQIGKQSQQQANASPQRRDDAEDNQYRHAFLILEPKRKDSSSLVRHVLCAENDEERDAWVDALLQHVDWPEDASPVELQVPNVTRLQKQQPSQDSTRSLRKDSPGAESLDRLQGISYDDTVAAEAPVRGPNHRDVMGAKPSKGSPRTANFSQDSLGHYPTISAPSNGAPIQDAQNWGNRLAVGPTPVKDKKRSIFGFRGRGGSNDLAPVQINNQLQGSYLEQRSLPANRSIFGIPLQEAVEYTQPVGMNVVLPAVVYRCLEYLHEKQAINEEGIFRLSGSNIVIKGLRDRFNTEGDIKLLDGEYYDVHAVASLLKLYLRELPSSILTRELHLDFLKVLGMSRRKNLSMTNVS